MRKSIAGAVAAAVVAAGVSVAGATMAQAGGEPAASPPAHESTACQADADGRAIVVPGVKAGQTWTIVALRSGSTWTGTATGNTVVIRWTQQPITFAGIRVTVDGHRCEST